MSRRDPMPSREELVAWDDTCVWHPFTPHGVCRAEDPLMVVVVGDGPRSVDWPRSARFASMD